MRIAFKIFIGAFITLLLIAIISFFYLDNKFKKHKSDSFLKEYPLNQKMWPHRGYSVINQNYRLEDISLAAQKGFFGIELDLFFSIEKRDFLVTHELPVKDTLWLSDLLNTNKNRFFYWFDLKNLSRDNVDSAFEALQTINKNYRLNNQFFIESKEAKELAILKNKGINTCLWIKTPNKNKLFSYYYWRYKNKWDIVYYDFSTVSFPADLLDKQEYQDYNHLNICTWTNKSDSNQLDDILLNHQQIKVLLFDRVEGI